MNAQSIPSSPLARAPQPASGLVSLAVLLALASAAGCESGPVGPSSAPAAEPSAAQPGAAGSPTAALSNPAVSSGTPAGKVSVAKFGAALEPASSTPLASLLANPKAYADQTVTTEGKVQRACSRKGCWMEIGSGDDACRITFKDYAFFVPTDSAGALAKIQGRLDTREVEAAAVNHLESEGARFRNKKPDGSATEVRLIASAVELTR